MLIYGTGRVKGIDTDICRRGKPLEFAGHGRHTAIEAADRCAVAGKQSMSQVKVSPAVLAWAIQRSGHAPQDLGDRFKKLHLWLDGTEPPTLRQLEQLASATHTPLGLLFLDVPPVDKLSIPHFRTMSGDAVKAPSVDLIETIQAMEYRQAWIREYGLAEGKERMKAVGSATVGQTPESVASKMRDALGLSPNWTRSDKTWEDVLRRFSTALEDAGILVVLNGVVGNDTHRRLDPEEFRGFVLADDVVPLIFVNGADSKRAQMFTLAHELAHVVFGFSAAFDLREMAPADDQIERACDRAAEEFLLPEKEFKDAWTRAGKSSKGFAEIGTQFRISDVIVARRAYDLDLIARGTFDDFYAEYAASVRAAKSDSSGGNFYNSQPFKVGRSFGQTVVRALHEGKLLYTEAYRMTGLHGATFEKFALSIENGARR